MENTIGNSSHWPPSLDRPSRLLLTVVLVVSAWQLALPLWPWVQQVTMRRFQLRTENYWAWAMQQCIPSMYSFENRYWVLDRDPNSLLGDLSESHIIESRVINHFPARVFTFGDNRYRFLTSDLQAKSLLNTDNKVDQQRFLIMRSSYRGLQYQSLCTVKRAPEGHLQWHSNDYVGKTP